MMYARTELENVQAERIRFLEARYSARTRRNQSLKRSFRH